MHSFVRGAVFLMIVNFVTFSVFLLYIILIGLCFIDINFSEGLIVLGILITYVYVNVC